MQCTYKKSEKIFEAWLQFYSKKNVKSFVTVSFTISKSCSFHFNIFFHYAKNLDDHNFVLAIRILKSLYHRPYFYLSFVAVIQASRKVNARNGGHFFSVAILPRIEHLGFFRNECLHSLIPCRLLTWDSCCFFFCRIYCVTIGESNFNNLTLFILS